jgi:hypothetical protein
MVKKALVALFYHKCPYFGNHFHEFYSSWP